eukprot:Nitzschia sp. Nitz4//scaffold405_size10492//8242//9993//NITZ4_009073-RA/size10492-processed-gene-0.11-mRNA-1//-1//CDS//3329551118//6247//frame0
MPYNSTSLGATLLCTVTMSLSMLSPLRDAVALQLGVDWLPQLTLASSLLAFLSSVPIGWLFEAPDPARRRFWKKMGVTRGETQGTSLALMFRFFGVGICLYTTVRAVLGGGNVSASGSSHSTTALLIMAVSVAFYLWVHVIKLHATSLVWAVTTQAMDFQQAHEQYHDNSSTASDHHNTNNNNTTASNKSQRLASLSRVGLGGTIGGLLGSSLASSLPLPVLLGCSILFLEWAAETSIELGTIMQHYWQWDMLHNPNNNSQSDLSGFLASGGGAGGSGSAAALRRSSSMGSMKRIASTNSMRSLDGGGGGDGSGGRGRAQSFSSTDSNNSAIHANSGAHNSSNSQNSSSDTFTQRLLRGITTILHSRLLMAIFTYNALYSSTTVLLSFQRAALVVHRNQHTNVKADTAFLARVQMLSNLAVFMTQATGIGSGLAHRLGSRGSLALMPAIRWLGVTLLAWWQWQRPGQSPNLTLFLVLDESTRVVNLAVAKPVRESLWQGLSSEARYEAKPIVDTLANRWGAGSASFCVSMVQRALEESNYKVELMGLPPVVVLCWLVAAWWAMVSWNLGLVRRRIDLELKKRA